MTNPQPQQIQVKISDEVLKGVYANMAQIAHSKEEFVIDFLNLMPPSGIVNARVYLSPAHTKRLAAALLDNVKKYEDQFGKIDEGSAQAPEIGFKTA
ncbi:MAG: hypothetical protein UV57_C0004G0006 [Parcubacteria group bacterium GW2011_GWD2_43_10]|uniref:DUF3467 domain-containing protein n=1 Tax=Candidatus Veblenbacteria bacterium RIFOXYA2_FULL_43_9 TaxID=1802425 RepID=A0A1G2Q2W0_9BACT|nr:MAG: hypothetical protein UV57_C0004G0006 [Parcubacteria group bacterium GW2011_GWD2_43_10]OHA54369.1 MAG: hypothetical protein A2226_03080 [Candidatus Veblenbacteria bacterium RIFOXYA2_FULL_43_9]HCX38644.1 DUF3467 domain-containing protein [Candidatus Veblenbacteria bacterium]